MTSLSDQAFRDHELRTINPPADECPEEICDRCDRPLDDDGNMQVRDPRYPSKGVYAIYCADCAMPAVRCDVCHFVRCNCDDR